MNQIPLFYYRDGCFGQPRRYPYNTYLSLEVLMKFIKEKYINITLIQILKVYQTIILYSKQNKNEFGQFSFNAENLMIKCVPPFENSFLPEQQYEIEVAQDQSNQTQDVSLIFFEGNQSNIISLFNQFVDNMLSKKQKELLHSIINNIQFWDKQDDLNDQINSLNEHLRSIIFKAENTHFSKGLDQLLAQAINLQAQPLDHFILLQQLKYFLKESRVFENENINQLQNFINEISTLDNKLPEMKGFFQNTIIEYQNLIVAKESIRIQEYIIFSYEQQQITQYFSNSLDKLSNKTGIQFLFQNFLNQFKTETEDIIAVSNLFTKQLDRLIVNTLCRTNQKYPLFNANKQIFKKQLSYFTFSEYSQLHEFLQSIYQQLELEEEKLQVQKNNQLQYEDEFNYYNAKLLELIQQFNNNIKDPELSQYFGDRNLISESINQIRIIIKSQIFNISCGDNFGTWQYKISQPNEEHQQEQYTKCKQTFDLHFNVCQQQKIMQVSVRTIHDLVILSNIKKIMQSEKFVLDLQLVTLVLQIQEIEEIDKTMPYLDYIFTLIMKRFKEDFITTYLNIINQTIDNKTYIYQQNIGDFVQTDLKKTSKTAYQLLFSNYLDHNLRNNNQQNIQVIINNFGMMRFELILKHLRKSTPQYSCEIIVPFYQRIEQRLQQLIANDEHKLSQIMHDLYFELRDLQIIIDRTRLPEKYFQDYRQYPDNWIEAFTRHDNPQWADYLIDKEGQFQVSSLNTCILQDKFDLFYQNLSMAKNLVINYDKHMVRFFTTGIDLQKHQLIWEQIIYTVEFKMLCFKKIEEFRGLCLKWFIEKVKDQMDEEYQQSY